jgi:murein DD-endopeptidase MepM/ murein hydrolase activator NlpD
MPDSADTPDLHNRPDTASGQRADNRESGLYRLLIFIGLISLRRQKLFLRRVFRAAKTIMRKTGRLLYNLRRGFLLFCVRNGIPVIETVNTFRTLTAECRLAFRNGAWTALVFCGKTTLRALRRGVVMVSSINYLAPIAAGIILYTVVMATVDMTFALAVQFNGEMLGYIKDESIFEKAENEVFKRIAFEDFVRQPDKMPVFSISVVKPEQIVSENELTNRLIRASGSELTEAAGLYIDGKFLGAVTDEKRLKSILDSLLDKYRTGELEESVGFVKDVQIKSGLFPPSAVIDAEDLRQELSREEAQQRVYIAVSGDSPILIAQKNKVSYAQLKALNPNIEKQLMIGQEVLVEKAVPTLEVKVMRIETFEERIPFKIEQVQDASKYQGYVQVTRVGQYGINEKTARVTYIDGVETDREIIDTHNVKAPVNERIVVGGLVPLQKIPGDARNASSNFLWPADGGYVTCLFGSAGYYGHTGLDIGGLPQGSAIRAAASGTVIKVAYNNYGYGYHIMISHGGGVETLYAHNSKIYVKVGDWVEQGQLIAGMGRTGRATGIHVHFEIRINGKYVNPANYIGTRYARS